MSRPFEVSDLEHWSELSSSAYVPLRVDGADPFRAALRARDLADISVSQVGATASTITRTQRLVASDPREVLLYSVILRGGCAIAQGGGVVMTGPGAGYLLDSDRSYAIRIGAMNDMIGLRVPMSEIGLKPKDLRAVVGIPLPAEAAATRILTKHLAGMLLGVDDGTRDEEEQRELALELLRAALHQLVYGAESRPVHRGLGLAVAAKWHIDQHHADGSLTVEDIAERLMVSRRHLETQFARTGVSPAGYLRSVRLERGRRLLLSERRPSVEAAARMAGFGQVDTFIRAFRRQYEATPAEWRRAQPDRSGAPRHEQQGGALMSDLRPVVHPYGGIHLPR